MHSEYFSSICRDNNEDEKITLPQVKPVVFADFQSWLYSREYLIVRDNCPPVGGHIHGAELSAW
jgi:hypothetical protein